MTNNKAMSAQINDVPRTPAHAIKPTENISKIALRAGISHTMYGILSFLRVLYSCSCLIKISNSEIYRGEPYFSVT